MDSRKIKVDSKITLKSKSVDEYSNSYGSFFINADKEVCFYIDKMKGREILLDNNIKTLDIDQEERKIKFTLHRAFDCLTIKCLDIDKEFWDLLVDFSNGLAKGNYLDFENIKKYRSDDDIFNDPPITSIKTTSTKQVTATIRNVTVINKKDNENIKKLNNTTTTISKTTTTTTNINTRLAAQSILPPLPSLPKKYEPPEDNIKTFKKQSFNNSSSFNTFKNLKQGQLSNDPINDDKPDFFKNAYNNISTIDPIEDNSDDENKVKPTPLSNNRFRYDYDSPNNEGYNQNALIRNKRLLYNNSNNSSYSNSSHPNKLRKSELINNSKSYNTNSVQNRRPFSGQYGDGNGASNSSVAKPKHKGLNNLGNTCYMNVILQSLFGIKRLYDYIKETKERNFKNNINIYNVLLKVWNSVLFEKDELYESDMSLFSKSTYGFSSYSYSQYPSYSNSYNRFGSYKGIDPEDLKRCIDNITPIFKGYSQHDAHEFLVSLFDILEEQLRLYIVGNFKNQDKEKENLEDKLFLKELKELGEIENNSDEEEDNSNDENSDSDGNDNDHQKFKDKHSIKKAKEEQNKQSVNFILKEVCPISNNFKSKIVNKLICCNCNDISYSEEFFNDISLNIPKNSKNLNELVENYFKLEIIERKCSKCNCNKTKLVKFFTSTANVLVLHIKRFQMNFETKSFLKNNSPIQPPESLILNQFDFEIPPPKKENEKEDNSSNLKDTNNSNKKELNSSNKDDSSASSDEETLKKENNNIKANNNVNKSVNNNQNQSSSSSSSTSTSPSMTPPDQDIFGNENSTTTTTTTTSTSTIESTQSESTQSESSEEYYPSNRNIVNYSLHSIVQHSGTLDTGHYICCMNTNNQWNQFDDSFVSPLDKESVLSIKNGYIFFYIKK